MVIEGRCSEDVYQAVTRVVPKCIPRFLKVVASSDEELESMGMCKADLKMVTMHRGKRGMVGIVAKLLSCVKDSETGKRREKFRIRNGIRTRKDANRRIPLAEQVALWDKILASKFSI